MKKTNKIKILDLLGFESDILIENTKYNLSDDISVDYETSKNTFEDLLDTTTEININNTSSLDTYIDQVAKNSSSKVSETPTDTFNPLNITQQIQKVWSDIESRRKWVRPTFFTTLGFMIVVVSIYFYNDLRSSQKEVLQESIVVTSNSNELITLLPTLIEISTNTFYSKYDVSNASANLQQIESTLIQYRTNLEARTDIQNIDSLYSNLNNIFLLIDELDLVITYRILTSEILIYNELPVDEERVDIGNLTIELSNIVAQSKVNYSNLPDLNEFAAHKNLINIAIATAEDLHGRYLGALRNNEYEVAKSIANAILLNKETEVKAFENSLNLFNEKSLEIYNSFTDLP